MPRTFFLVMISFILLLSCKKDEAVMPDDNHGNTATPTGTPAGSSTTKVIGNAGGAITSDDGVISIIIPAGALTGNKEITIQPVAKQLPSASGRAYRLTPHGEQFSVPVTIIFNYKSEDLVGTAAEFLGIAFQDEQGNWQAVTNSSVDKINKQIKTTTTHFSDWTYFVGLKLQPSVATVDLGATLELKATTVFPYIDPDAIPGDELTVPVFTEPRELKPSEVVGWSYAGSGSLESQVAKSFYTAPHQEPLVNPEAVTINVNLARKGQFMIVSNITVLANKSVDYLHVDEDWNNPVNNGKCALYMYGNFGIDPGPGNRSITINSNPVEVDVWTPGFIRCKIDELIHGAIEIKSNGNVVASSVLRKFEGKIIYERFHGGILNSGSANALKEITEFDIVYRGFGKPCPPGITSFEIPKSLAVGTQAFYTLKGSASVTMPGTCPFTTSVTLPTTSGSYGIDPLTWHTLSGLQCEVEETEDGITANFKYHIPEVIKNVKVNRSNCIFNSENPTNLGVGMEGFHHQPISFVFSGTTGIKLKQDEMKSNLMSSGILIEAWDGTGNPSHYETDGLMKATLKNL